MFRHSACNAAVFDHEAPLLRLSLCWRANGVLTGCPNFRHLYESESEAPNLAGLIVALMHQSGKTFSYEVESF